MAAELFPDVAGTLHAVLKKLLTPQWVARIVGLVGAVTLLSAVLPAVHDRARILILIEK